MTYVDDDGVRGSISYLPPTTPEELLRRRRNTEVWTERSFGMLGRLPDFCAAMIVGFHDTRDGAQRTARWLWRQRDATISSFARQNDLALSHGLHDPHMDKTMRPQPGPGPLPAHRRGTRQRRGRARRALRHTRSAQQRGRRRADLRAGRRRRRNSRSGLPVRSICRASSRSAAIRSPCGRRPPIIRSRRATTSRTC